MSYLELDEEEEYDLMCKFEDYYMKHIEKQENKKNDSNIIYDINIQREKEKNVKPKRSFARSKFISPKNNDSKNETITLYYY